MEEAVTGIIKTQIILFIAFIIFLVLVVVSGRILDDINKSSCKNDLHIANASRWTKVFLAVTTVSMGLTLIAFIALFFI